MTSEKFAMKLSKLGFFMLGTWLIAGTTISSCQKSQQDSMDTTQKTSTPTTPVSTTTNNYITEYPVYKSSSEKELAANKDTITSIRERLKNANAKLKAALEREEQAVEKANADLQLKIESYKDQGEKAWAQFKANFDRSMDSIRSNIKDIETRIESIKQED
jgi:hypothetical protein